MYYFKADMSGLYLILKVPYERKTKTKYGKYYASYLRNKSNYIREFLEENGKLEDNLVFSVDLAENRVKSKLHDSATIVAKYYDKYTIPSTEDLVLDIKRFSDLRKFILNNYTDQIDISVDEWISALEDNSVIDNKMFSIFDIMYDMPGCQATTGQLIKIREKLGYMNEKSYNSAIIANSNRVKNFLNKKAVYNKDGTENYWMRFFYGTEVRARNKGKTGKAFQFTLKDELIEALGKANRNDDEVDVLENVYDNDLEEDYIETERVDDMVEEKIFNSFYDYLLYKGYFFDKKTIENYLLSLKAKPFAILTGNSGTGKTKLSQLFAQYLTDNHPLENEDAISSINTEVLVGKSSESGGWSLNRNDIKDLIPIDELENTYSIIVDGVPANANLKLNPRLFYKGNELKQHLEKLAEEDQKQKVPLEILLDEKIVNSSNKEYISFKTSDSRIYDDFFGLSDHFVCGVLGLDKYGEMDFYFDGQKSREHFWARTQAKSNDKDLIKHLKSLDNLSDLEIKINKEDLFNTLLKSDFVEETNISFERKIGAHQNWCMPSNSFKNFLHVKNSSNWRVIVDGIEAIVEFALYSVCFSLSDDDLRNHFSKKDPNDTIEIKADLSTISYYGDKSELFKEFSSEFKENGTIIDSNYKIIPVGANWTENRHIVGYYNVITNEYQSTPAYDLIKAANKSTEPYFLILDEMNLSHVERYFADFLSAIESGEKIPLYGEEELTLPENLFIIGTVNVDETTYMFSPKVLDRANVIEFETYSARDYMNNEINLTAPSGNISYLENPLAGDEIRSYGIDELRNLFDEVEYEGELFWNLLTNEIYEFQKILKESGFDFGFRVINEIVRFMAVAWEYEDKPDEFTNWKRYFDACIKQKLLPKLHGSEKIIGETLDKLYSKCVGKHLTYETANYPESARKLKEMRDILTKQRYVSFIN